VAYQDAEGAEIFNEELAECMKHSMFVNRDGTWVKRPVEPLVLNQRRAKYKRLIQDIEDGKPIRKANKQGAKPVRRQPALWELWQTWESNTPLRIYYGEPNERLEVVVAFLAHIKDISCDSKTIAEVQDDRMDCAGERCEELFARRGWTSN